MLRPAIGCSTFAVFDFIRVPPPAARTITVRSSGTVTPFGSVHQRTSTLASPTRGSPRAPAAGSGYARGLVSSPGRSRTYVASPDSKSGGPCRQTNRGSVLKGRTREAGQHVGPADQPGIALKG